MNNIELEQKIKEIIAEDNYFEMIIKAREFESEYKKSDFYKITKKPLNEVIRESKIYYALQLRDFGKYLQQILDNLNMSNVSNLLDQVNNIFGQENAEIKEGLEILSNLK